MADLLGLARMTVSSSGTGSITLNSAVTGFATFDTAYNATAGSTTPPGGVQVQYAINDTTQSEQGTGVYTSSNTLLTRGSSAQKSVITSISTSQTTPIAMSNAAQVFITPTPQYYNVLTGKNKIINGAMEIDQRNVGAASSTALNTYWLDRWNGGTSGTGVFTIQQSTTAPAGFKNSMLITVTTADAAIATTDAYYFNQKIEGINCTDLNFGASTAKTITLSFWVRASVTGTYGGVLSNSAINRSYPFQYTVNTANTFEYKTVTVAGDTTGTWLTTTGVGLTLIFDLGSGATYQGAAGAWAASALLTATGSTQMISTNGATLYISGVQIEAGALATSFERRQYGEELALCQRYYWKSFNQTTAPAQNVGILSGEITNFTMRAGANLIVCPSLSFPVTMRATPTVVFYNPAAANAQMRDESIAVDCTSTTTRTVSDNSISIQAVADAGTVVGSIMGVHVTASIEL
tara:strand:- start:995 stop:2386 length:1392 start_codon:yes stop_codon:yes gene_type:complete